MRVGVLALQGAFREHILSFEALGITAIAVRLPEQMDDLSALVVPGGESTAIGKLMRAYHFYDAIRERHRAGMAVWGTCAGAILMATEIVDATQDQEPLGLMDCSVRRNAYGRQADSFETGIRIDSLGELFPGVFIRAPVIERVGPGVKILGRYDDQIVAAQEGHLLTTTFHPELTGDLRMHRYFIEHVIGVR